MSVSSASLGRTFDLIDGRAWTGVVHSTGARPANCPVLSPTWKRLNAKSFLFLDLTFQFGSIHTLQH